VAKAGTFAASQVLTAAELNAGAAGWATWTPGYSGVTVGNGTVVAVYAYYGRTYFVYWQLTMGTTSSITGAVNVSGLPVAAVTAARLSGQPAYLNGRPGFAVGATTTQVVIRCWNTAGTYADFAELSATVPISWTTGNTLAFSLRYEGVS
jgi:hypothetical protein